MAPAFIKALSLKQVDLLGFSIGGTVTQALTLAEPQLVRRLVLVGTGPRGGEGMATLTPEAQRIFGASHAEPGPAVAARALRRHRKPARPPGLRS